MLLTQSVTSLTRPAAVMTKDAKHTNYTDSCAYIPTSKTNETTARSGQEYSTADNHAQPVPQIPVSHNLTVTPHPRHSSQGPAATHFSCPQVAAYSQQLAEIHC